LNKQFKKKKEAERNLATAIESRQLSQTSYDDMKREIDIQERKQDLKILEKIIQRTRDLRRELKSAKFTEKPPIDILKIECDLEISYAKALQIRLKHDLPNPGEDESETTEDENATLGITDTNNGSLTEVPVQEETNTESLQSSVDLEITSQNSELTEQLNFILTPELKQIKIDSLSAQISELEDSLQYAIAKDDFEKADALQEEINAKSDEIAQLREIM